MKKCEAGTYIFVCECMFVCVCIFIYQLRSKNNCAAASWTSSETCKEVTRVMKLCLCKSMSSSCKFVNSCAKAQVLQAAESNKLLLPLHEDIDDGDYRKNLKDRERYNSKSQLVFITAIDGTAISLLANNMLWFVLNRGEITSSWRVTESSQLSEASGMQ